MHLLPSWVEIEVSLWTHPPSVKRWTTLVSLFKLEAHSPGSLNAVKKIYLLLWWLNLSLGHRKHSGVRVVASPEGSGVSKINHSGQIKAADFNLGVRVDLFLSLSPRDGACTPERDKTFELDSCKVKANCWEMVVTWRKGTEPWSKDCKESWWRRNGKT